MLSNLVALESPITASIQRLNEKLGSYPGKAKKLPVKAVVQDPVRGSLLVITICGPHLCLSICSLTLGDAISTQLGSSLRRRAHGQP